MATFKIYGDGVTANGQTHICNSCTYQSRVKNDRGHTYQRCAEFNTAIGRNIVECNQHVDRNHPSINGMQQIAWILSTDKTEKGRRIGFQSPAEWRKNKPFENPIDME